MAVAQTCRCGHDREAHRHHRAGSDCAFCGPACRRFRPAHPLRHAVGRVADALRRVR